MNVQMPLNRLEIGMRATIVSVRQSAKLRRRLGDLGFVPGIEVEALMKSPAGDPTAYMVMGAVIALRSEDAEDVICTSAE